MCHLTIPTFLEELCKWSLHHILTCGREVVPKGVCLVVCEKNIEFYYTVEGAKEKKV